MDDYLRVADGYILIYRLYDVANELDLARADAIIRTQARYASTRLRLRRVRPRAVYFVNPPLTVTVDVGRSTASEWTFPLRQVTVRLYDFGVVSVRLEVPIPPRSLMKDAEDLFRRVLSSSPDAMCRRIAHQVLEEISPAVYKPQWEADQWEAEDYVILYIRRFATTTPLRAEDVLSHYDIPRLLMGEEFDVSRQVKEAVLRYTYTYSPEDIAVISWETAFVYDVEGIMDIPDLLEFANAQLLELVYFDELLDDELENAYDDVELVRIQGRGVLRYRHLQRILSRMMMTVVEITELSGRVMNALKVTEDVYYAMVYTGATEVLGLNTWMKSVQQKVETLRSIYIMLAEEAADARMMLLEISIVILILAEIILAILGRL